MGRYYKKVEAGPSASPSLLVLTSIPSPFSALYGRGLTPAGFVHQAPVSWFLAGSSQCEALTEDWRAEKEPEYSLQPSIPHVLATLTMAASSPWLQLPLDGTHCGSSVHLVTTASEFQSQYLLPFIPPVQGGIGFLLLLMSRLPHCPLTSQLFHYLYSQFPALLLKKYNIALLS